MVFDTLENSYLYNTLSPDIACALHYLRTTDFFEREPYKEKLNDNIVMTYSHYNTVTVDSRRWSAHDSVIEVQYVVSGEEKLGFAPRDTMEYQSSAAEKDILYFAGTGNWLQFTKGHFAVLFPDDVHIPKISTELNPSEVRKVVFKIATTAKQNYCEVPGNEK